MEPLKVGDVVQLKSGGPRMTIQSIGSFPSLGMDNAAECVWFDSTTMNKQVFALDILIRYVVTPITIRTGRRSSFP